MRGRSTNTNCCRCWFAVTDDLEKQGHTPPSEREGREASQPKDRYEKKLRWELRRNSSTVFLFTLPPWICKIYPHLVQQLDPEAICLAGYMSPLRK
ncbi:unnamed protein product [Brassica rapa]|uniref:Uncharacterized protein n=1 Tax=Brassica campestris TaxID=3711 RepID=A0A8D9G373_BRACM|nr:unnamed protein product [Brassica rapa]CAG7877953.1 unnamed protein product [Brassica rapa]